MSKIILFGSRKGGVGKTTLTALCANALSSPPFSRSVYVADIDQQQSLIRRRLLDIQSFAEIPPYKIGAPTLAELLGDIAELDRKHEFIFIDHAAKLDNHLPADQQEITKILLIADFLFIPITPGNYSLDSTLDYLKLALKIKAKRTDRPLEVIALVNMSEPRTLDAQELSDQLAELKAMTPIKLLSAELGRYALFRAVDTLTSFYDPESSDKARANFAEFINEFIKIVDQ
jgi:chromosome partitioning protein